MLTLDYSYMMADVVGSAYGVTDADLQQEAARVNEIHGKLQARRGLGELPFYDLPFNDDLQPIIDLADELASRFDDLVVLGIGGSALGTTAVARALLPIHYNLMSRQQRRSRPRLFVLDNVDPAGVNDTLELLDPARTCFCVISKSGTTVETMSQFLLAREWVRAAVGVNYKHHFILITDPEKGVLRQLATEAGYRSCDVPEGVGGRFSVFSAVGLLPLAVAGIDIRELLAGAVAINPQLTDGNLFANPAYLNGLLQYLAYRKGAHISVMMPYSDHLRDVADWYRQLWAESLGKRENLAGETVYFGPTPVKALGATDQHSQLQLYMEGPFDKVVTFLSVENLERAVIPATPDIPELDYLSGKCLSTLLTNEQRATAVALASAGRPNCTIRLPEISPQTVGALLFMFEVQTVFSGALFGVDSLDQPGVESSKIITSAFMGRPGFTQQRTDVEKWENLTESKVLTVG